MGLVHPEMASQVLSHHLERMFCWAPFIALEVVSLTVSSPKVGTLDLSWFFYHRGEETPKNASD